MKRIDLGVFLTIVSHRRPSNVLSMMNKVGSATWIVGPGEGLQYKAAGAEFVVEQAGGLISQRNRALELAFKRDVPCVQLDDDMVDLHLAVDKKTKKKISFNEAIQKIQALQNECKASLLGGPPTTNLFYFNPMRPVSMNKFIIGSFMYVMPSDIRFDPDLRLKEDYDFTVQHSNYMGAVRMNDLFFEFKHYGNSGGCQEYRTDALERDAAERLMRKWPGRFRAHPKRENEVILK